ncbi:bifunctional riboflavin kinase/FAD synthetase [Candidatus Latescibacterota bacterium]
MEIYKEFKPGVANCGFKTVVTLGAFDGVHLGHRKIIDKVIESSKKLGLQAAVLTFERHPVSVLNPKYSPKLLSTQDEKLEKLKKIGIDAVFVLKFSKSIADMTAEQFITDYLINCLGMKHFIIGYDHKLGKDGVASSEILQEFAIKHNFELEIIQPIRKDGILVKSSVIRKHISEGNVSIASLLLGENYSFSGKVVEGQGIGKILGYPTANISPLSVEKIIPAHGVYGGWIEIDSEKKDAVISLGPNPTFNNSVESIEIHIPDFKGNLYGKTVRAGFVRKLRNIEKFKSKEELTSQIKNDIESFITNPKNIKGEERNNGNYKRTKK